MQLHTRQKHIFIYVLLCALLFTGLASIFSASGSISPELNVIAGSSLSCENSQSSMQSSTNSRQFGNLSNTESSFLLALRQSQKLITRNGLDTVNLAIAALMIYAICSASLLQKTCTPFNSLQITVFLHKKDGMK